MTARRASRCAALLLTAAMTLTPIGARADAEADAAKAFDDGRKLFEQKKDAPAALPLFQQAVDQTGSPNARLYLARCLREVGKTARAYDEMARTVRDARDRAEKDERYVATRDAAAAELAVLEGKVGHIVITLDSTLKDARVSLEGVAIASGELGKPLTVVPGEVRVVAEPPNGVNVERRIWIKAAGTESITLARETSTAAPPPAPVTPEKPAGDSAGFGVVRGLGIGVAAVGVGGIALFAVGMVKADDELATLEAACGAGPCDASYADVIDSGKTWETVSFVGLGVGIAGVLAGTAMMIWGGPSEPEKPGSQAAAFEPTRDGFRVRF